MTPAGAATPAEPFGPAAAIAGVVRYGGALAQQGYRLNRFLTTISWRENRQAFLDDEEAAMQAAGLSPEERDLVRRRDYPAMLRYGVNVYALAKSGYVFGQTLMDIGRQMRAQGEADAWRS